MDRCAFSFSFQENSGQKETVEEADVYTSLDSHSFSPHHRVIPAGPFEWAIPSPVCEEVLPGVAGPVVAAVVLRKFQEKRLFFRSY